MITEYFGLNTYCMCSLRMCTPKMSYVDFMIIKSKEKQVMF